MYLGHFAEGTSFKDVVHFAQVCILQALGRLGRYQQTSDHRIGNHVHVLYRYIAIAGNRSRCSGSQSVAEVLAVSVVKVVGKEKNKL